MPSVKKQITVAGKLYGYWLHDGVLSRSIRSESNPWKTPCLREGSASYRAVMAAVKVAEQDTPGGAIDPDNTFDQMVEDNYRDACGC